MIGEKPESLANWTTTMKSMKRIFYRRERKGLPCCPTDDDPPKMTMGCPAYLPRPPSSHGGDSPAPLSGSTCSLYKPSAAVAIVKGMVAAWSKVRLEGICRELVRFMPQWKVANEPWLLAFQARWYTAETSPCDSRKIPGVHCRVPA